jgi:DNA-binding response OmpR family regulator
MTCMTRVLLIEDNRDLAATLWDYLESHGFTVDHASDGLRGLHRALTEDHDLVVLDIGLPKIDGLEVCRQLRAAGRQLPVLMLTGRDTLADKLHGFGEGADDYLVKPFELKELLARLHAMLRRSQAGADIVLRVADLEFEPACYRVRRAGATVPVARAGMRLLELLMRRSPTVVSHADMELALWGERLGNPNAMRSHLHALRSAIDKPFAKHLLHSVQGIGYRLSDDDADESRR